MSEGAASKVASCGFLGFGSTELELKLSLVKV